MLSRPDRVVKLQILELLLKVRGLRPIDLDRRDGEAGEGRSKPAAVRPVTRSSRDFHVQRSHCRGILHGFDHFCVMVEMGLLGVDGMAILYLQILKIVVADQLD